MTQVMTCTARNMYYRGEKERWAYQLTNRGVRRARWLAHSLNVVPGSRSRQFVVEPSLGVWLFIHPNYMSFLEMAGPR